MSEVFKLISYKAQSEPTQQHLNFVDGDKYEPLSVDVYLNINNYSVRDQYIVRPYIVELEDTQFLIQKVLERMRKYPQFKQQNEYAFNSYMRQAREWMQKLEPFLKSKLKKK